MAAVRIAVSAALVGCLLAGCGGGGDGANSVTPSLTSPSGSGSTGGTASVTTTPNATLPVGGATSAGTVSTTAVTIAHYALGSTAAVDSSYHYQDTPVENLTGMARTPDGGYLIVWEHGLSNYFEQRYDSSGQRIGDITGVPQPTEDLSPSRANRVSSIDGGYLEVEIVWLDPASRLGGGDLYVQHFSADGTPIDEPIHLGHTDQGGWQWAWLSMPDGEVALVYQAAARVFTTPLLIGMLKPQ